MAEEKQGFEQLNQDDLSNVKAGIPPYETPVIVDLAALLDVECGAGLSCHDGIGKKCINGDDCITGVRPE